LVGETSELLSLFGLHIAHPFDFVNRLLDGINSSIWIQSHLANAASPLNADDVRSPLSPATSDTRHPTGSISARSCVGALAINFALTNHRISRFRVPSWSRIGVNLFLRRHSRLFSPWQPTFMGFSFSDPTRFVAFLISSIRRSAGTVSCALTACAPGLPTIAPFALVEIDITDC
jgi:hypothetical protein